MEARAPDVNARCMIYSIDERNGYAKRTRSQYRRSTQNLPAKLFEDAPSLARDNDGFDSAFVSTRRGSCNIENVQFCN